MPGGGSRFDGKELVALAVRSKDVRRKGMLLMWPGFCQTQALGAISNCGQSITLMNAEDGK